MTVSILYPRSQHIAPRRPRNVFQNSIGLDWIVLAQGPNSSQLRRDTSPGAQIRHNFVGTPAQEPIHIYLFHKVPRPRPGRSGLAQGPGPCPWALGRGQGPGPGPWARPERPGRGLGTLWKRYTCSVWTLGTDARYGSDGSGPSSQIVSMMGWPGRTNRWGCGSKARSRRVSSIPHLP